MLLGISVAYWWVAAVAMTALFWGTLVPGMPTARTRRQMAVAPVVAGLSMCGLYWGAGFSAAMVLATYAAMLLMGVAVVLPFRRPIAEMIVEDEQAGRDVRDRGLKDMPRGMAPWGGLVITATVVLIVTAMAANGEPVG